MESPTVIMHGQKRNPTLTSASANVIKLHRIHKSFWIICCDHEKQLPEMIGKIFDEVFMNSKRKKFTVILLKRFAKWFPLRSRKSV
jgi:hypothetical protein